MTYLFYQTCLRCIQAKPQDEIKEGLCASCRAVPTTPPRDDSRDQMDEAENETCPKCGGTWKHNAVCGDCGYICTDVDGVWGTDQ